ncbi:MAG TPA: divergent polysaccharide deacetylase family protein, partial [Rhodospirillales bacterium]|nr:divergent polysaccharide deacetylase family protein [Rhodospirillales bacterium]
MADNDLSGNDEISPKEEEEERLVEDENSDGAEEDQDGSSEELEEDEPEHEDETLGSDERLTETAPLEDDTEPPEEPTKKSHKKLITISSVLLGVLIFLTTGVIIIFGDNSEEQKTADGIMTPPSGYLARIAIPPRKRKRMKTGLELSREQTSSESNSPSAFSKPNSTKPEPSISAAFESDEKLTPNETAPGATDTKVFTARVIGARTVPGKGLVMPSVTAAAYNAIPLKQKSDPVTAPDESLMETIDDKVVPKLSSTGKGSWQTYNHPFTPTLQQIKTGEGDETTTIPYARVSIIIRGVGLNRNATLAAINKLPAAISLAFSPYGKGIEEWASLARGAGHETLMSLPMEPVDFPSLDPGPLSLLTDFKSETNVARLYSIMNLSQAYVGFIQHMGSRFTTSEAAFKPIIKILKDRGLLFVDDGLVKGGLGIRLASDFSLPHARSDMIIDDDASGVKIAQNLLQLEKIAKKNQSSIGLAKKNQSAIGIGEPYPATIMQIARWAKTLKGKMIDLAPISAVVRD